MSCRRQGGQKMYSSYSFLTAAPDGVPGQRNAQKTLYPPGKDPGTHCIGDWVGPRVGL
jgi:hypothetical protein